MGWVSLTLLGLLLLLCVVPQAKAELVARRQMLVDLQLWSREAEIHKLCGAKANGCIIMDTPGRVTIHGLKPYNWCDWARLRTLGHELMHGLGYGHNGYYVGNDNSKVTWRHGTCDMVRRDIQWEEQPAKQKGAE
jgi:hypothetical protein